MQPPKKRRSFLCVVRSQSFSTAIFSGFKNTFVVTTPIYTRSIEYILIYGLYQIYYYPSYFSFVFTMLQQVLFLYAMTDFWYNTLRLWSQNASSDNIVCGNAIQLFYYKKKKIIVKSTVILEILMFSIGQLYNNSALLQILCAFITFY